MLKDEFPDIVLWHCLNHRLELAVDNALNATRGTNDLKFFLESLYSLNSQSLKNMRDLSDCALIWISASKRIGKMFTIR